jgi:hypothetical protein
LENFTMTTMTQAHREYANRPQDERFPSVQALIDHAQHRKDRSKEVVYNAKDLRARADGGSVVLDSPKGSAAFTHWSFGQLSRSIGAPAGYLRELSPTLAADCLNHGLQHTPPATDLKLLVQAPNGVPTPVVRAATSERYGRVWEADLYGQVQSQILNHDDKWTTPPTWTGEPAGAYSGDRDSFVILTNGGSIVNDPSVANSNGAMFRGLMIRNSEVGAASVSIEQILFRYVCGNHMLWGAVMHRAFRRRHIGQNTLRDTIRQISMIATEWTRRSTAQDDAIIKTLIDSQIATTREGVIDELRKLGFSAEDAANAYTRCEQTEMVSPRSFWGIAQGTTRMSQDAGFQNDRLILDQLAAKVLARGAALVRV